jgi:hypothetical protein
MRIRSIKPEFWRSDAIARLPRDIRLLFIGLWSYVDDNGVGIDDERMIVADLFALDDDTREVRDYVREGLATLSREMRVTRYEVGGKRYLWIRNWFEHQRVDRANKPRYPLPPEVAASEDGPDGPDDTDPSRDPRETSAVGTGVQGYRGTGVVSTSSAVAPEMFARFYAIYPRRIGKKAAEKAWAKAMKTGADPELVIQSAQRYAASRVGQDPKYTPHPATWLNQGRWEDEPERTTFAPLNQTDANIAEFLNQGQPVLYALPGGETA